MSGLGNFLAGAAGGGGAGVASIASRYIDDEIQRNRMQALADIQHQTMVRGEEYMQSPEVQDRRLGNERNLLQMRSQEQLGAKVAEASSPELRQANIDNRVSFLQGTTPAEVQAQNAITEGTAGTKLDAERMRAKVMTPLEAERAGAISEAQWRARSEYDDRLDKSAGGGKGAKMSEAGKLQLQDINKQDEALQKAINDGVAGGTLKQDPNDPAWQHFTRQKQALQVQKVRVFAREGLISGADDAASLIASGATKADLETSMRQAQLIGGEYASQFSSAIRSRLSSMPAASPAGAPSAAPAPAQASQNLMDQRRPQSQPAPEGSPQAKWEARQAQAREEQDRRNAAKDAEAKRLGIEFDSDAQNMDPVALLQKYGDVGMRSSLDRSRLARLNQIERTIR